MTRQPEPSTAPAPSPAPQSSMSRRKFIAGTLAAAAFTIIKPELVRGTAANSKIEVGVIAMGQRGRRISKLMEEHGGYKVTAVADYFPEVAEEGGRRLNLDPRRCFSGLHGYKRLIASKVDAVILEAPPYAFPDHCSAAVEAGCHVYMAKPIACDVPGCLTIGELGKKVTGKKLVFFVDFQIRTDPFWIESVKRVHEGLIDKMSMICSHFTGEAFEDPPHTQTIESRLKNLVWCNDQALGGGHLVNAAVHALDAAVWVAGDKPPVRAMGCSRINRLDPHGDSPDTHSITYEFADGTILNHSCEHLKSQISDGNFCSLTAYGKTGTMFGAYEGRTWVHGNNGGYRGGKVENLSQVGLQRNLTTFHECVSKGLYDNPTVPTAVTSTLTAILGREAGAAGGTVTWDEMLKARKELKADLTGLKL